MPEREGARQPQRYCRNCGAEARLGNAFCTSCGANLVPRTEGHGPTHSNPMPPGRSGSFIDPLRTALQGAIQRLRGGSSAFRGGDLRSVPQGAMRWFKDLPAVPKAVLVGLVLLVLFVLLSPLAMLAAALLFGVSVIALIVRARQRRSKGRWPIVTVTSLVLILAFAGISNALYGTGYMQSIGESGGTKSTDNATDRGDQAERRGNASKAKDASSTKSANVAPGLEKLVESWRSGGKSPLFIPGYLPFSVTKAESSGTSYKIWSKDTHVEMMTLERVMYRSDMPREAAEVRRIAMEDDRFYYYVIEQDAPQHGLYSVVFWEESKDGVEFQYRLQTDFSTITPEEFMKMFRSMVRLD